ncbi:uncharacterized protein J7T54_000468 [Emericellopsis cladophorae]|uniref:Uncharacterized protein n=1 Tax=Emericellopsis cladophorae TaxID=2686198 RepID=A0A9P9XXQ5_9HYPO|nr:uncharacterized protein J7T54_000468 [Emericellopsis cladophorae]KAI6779370.1 hypothetical protein J7T54_000468 [Emericellopsis cladophorae]
MAEILILKILDGVVEEIPRARHPKCVGGLLVDRLTHFPEQVAEDGGIRSVKRLLRPTLALCDTDSVAIRPELPVEDVDEHHGY